MNRTALAKELDTTASHLRRALDGVCDVVSESLLGIIVATVAAIDATCEPSPELKQDKLAEEVTRLRLQNFKRKILIELDEGKRVDYSKANQWMTELSNAFRSTADLIARKSILTGDEVSSLFRGPIAELHQVLNEIQRIQENESCRD